MRRTWSRVKNWVAVVASGCFVFVVANLQNSFPSPLSESALTQRIADCFGYPLSELYVVALGFSQPLRSRTFAPMDPLTYSLWEMQVQSFGVRLPDGTRWLIEIDRYSGVIEEMTNVKLFQQLLDFEAMASHLDPETGIKDPAINLPYGVEDMIPPQEAIRLAHRYFRQYFRWGDTSNWRLVRLESADSPDNPTRWKKVQSCIIAGFEPNLPKPDGVELYNKIQYAEFIIHPLTGELIQYYGYYAPIDIPLEPLVTHDEAATIAVQKVQEITGKRAWVDPEWRPFLVLDQEPLNRPVRLVWGVPVLYGEPSALGIPFYAVGVDALTGEVVCMQE